MRNFHFCHGLAHSRHKIYKHNTYFVLRKIEKIHKSEGLYIWDVETQILAYKCQKCVEKLGRQGIHELIQLK